VVVATPSSTTNYTILATLGTCNASGTTTVTVNPLPTISANPGFICNGGSTTLNASGASSYTWSPASTLSSSSGSSVTASPTSNTQYTIDGTDGNGCTNTGVTSVTVVSNPTLSLGSASICYGQQTATLTAGGANNFNWMPNSGLNTTTGSTVLANPSTTTVYTVTGTIGSCTATATATVTVNSLPNITASSNSPVCVNDSLHLFGANGVSYQWSGPGGFSSSQPDPVINGVTNTAAGTYTVVAVDGNSCFNSASVNVVVNALPVVNAQGSTVCENGTINLSATGGNSYSWSGPNGYSSSLQSPAISNATQGMSGNYVVTVTDQNGCTGGNIAQVVVNALPTITFTPGVSCAGAPATLVAGGANIYSWSPANGLNTTSGTSVIANVTASTAYTVTGTSASGCVGTAVVPVTVNALPQVSMTPMNSSGCAPLCVNFNNTSANSTNCNWSFGDGGSDNTTCTPQHCFTTAGTYSATLTLTDANGCKNTAVAQVIVYPQPVAAFYSGPQPTTILEPTVNFTDNSSGAVITAWSWKFGDVAGGTSSIQNPSYSYIDAGNYEVQLIVISDHGCTNTVTHVVEIDEEYALYVPNAFSPNFDGTNDVFMPKGEGIKDYKLFVFDRWGNQVFFSSDLEKGWDGRFQSKGEDIVQEDVYTWKIELKSIKGTHKALSGTVTLIR
jgi:gliding motility-associated-like protein